MGKTYTLNKTFERISYLIDKPILVEGVIEELLSHKDKYIRIEALKLPGITRQHIEDVFASKYSNEPSSYELQIAAQHPAISLGRLRECLMSDNVELAIAASKNPSLTAELITEYIVRAESDKDGTCSYKVAKSLIKSDEISAVLIARLVQCFPWFETFTQPDMDSFHVLAYYVLKNEGLTK